MAFTVPPLPYAFDALEPYIDKQTMEIHHDKHHGAYVTNLNKALESAPDLQNKTSRGAAGQQLRHRAGKYPDGGAQQRRRPHQPQHVLADHGAESRRHSRRATSRRRSTALSEASISSRKNSTRRAPADSDPVGPGW